MEENKLAPIADVDLDVDIDPKSVQITEQDKEFTANPQGDLVPKVYETKVDSRGVELIIDPGKRNPRGRAGYEEKQELFWTIWLRLWREGRPSILAAGQAAGFSLNTSRNIGATQWFKDRKATLKRKSMFSRAEANIAKILSEEYKTMQLQDDGSQKVFIDKDVMKVVADVSKTVVTHLGKDDGWSTKTEVQGNMGGNINIKSISYADPIQVENQAVDAVAEKTQEAVKEIITNVVENKDAQ